MVSPWKVGARCRSDSISRLAMALPDTSGTDNPQQDRVHVIADHHIAAELGGSRRSVLSRCSGWWFIVSRQNRWSSDSVTVLPASACRPRRPRTAHTNCAPNCMPNIIPSRLGAPVATQVGLPHPGNRPLHPAGRGCTMVGMSDEGTAEEAVGRETPEERLTRRKPSRTAEVEHRQRPSSPAFRAFIASGWAARPERPKPPLLAAAPVPPPSAGPGWSPPPARRAAGAAGR